MKGFNIKIRGYVYPDLLQLVPVDSRDADLAQYSGCYFVIDLREYREYAQGMLPQDAHEWTLPVQHIVIDIKPEKRKIGRAVCTPPSAQEWCQCLATLRRIPGSFTGSGSPTVALTICPLAESLSVSISNWHQIDGQNFAELRVLDHQHAELSDQYRLIARQSARMYYKKGILRRNLRVRLLIHEVKYNVGAGSRPEILAVVASGAGGGRRQKETKNGVDDPASGGYFEKLSIG